MKKVALLIAHEGFQQVEYGIPNKLLTQKGITVTTVSDESGIATGKDLSKTKVDITIDKIDPQDFDGLFIIGGPGALDCLDNNIVHSLMKKTANLKKIFGAICISPRILAKAGLLTGKKATGWDGDNKLQEIFDQHDVNYVKKPVVIDDNIITATGPAAAQEFANAIINALEK